MCCSTGGRADAQQVLAVASSTCRLLRFRQNAGQGHDLKTFNNRDSKHPLWTEGLILVLGILPRLLGYAVTQLVEALRYKPEGCGFDSQWGH
jgi:hypothetical protein